LGLRGLPGCGLRLAAAAAACGLRGWWGWGRGRCGAAPALGADLRRKRQKAEQADRGLVPSPLSSSSLSLSLSSSSLVGHPATKFSRPAAQHPLWTGLRRRRQKAEQADRGLGLSSATTFEPVFAAGRCSFSLQINALHTAHRWQSRFFASRASSPDGGRGTYAK
jgi:hypothetical protein